MTSSDETPQTYTNNDTTTNNNNNNTTNNNNNNIYNYNNGEDLHDAGDLPVGLHRRKTASGRVQPGNARG